MDDSASVHTTRSRSRSVSGNRSGGNDQPPLSTSATSSTDERLARLEQQLAASRLESSMISNLLQQLLARGGNNLLPTPSTVNIGTMNAHSSTTFGSAMTTDPGQFATADPTSNHQHIAFK